MAKTNYFDKSGTLVSKIAKNPDNGKSKNQF